VQQAHKGGLAVSDESDIFVKIVSNYIKLHFITQLFTVRQLQYNYVSVEN